MSTEPEMNYNEEDYCDCPPQYYDDSHYKEGKKLMRITEEGHRIILESDGLQGDDAFYARVIETESSLVEKGEYSVFGKGFYKPFVEFP